MPAGIGDGEDPRQLAAPRDDGRAQVMLRHVGEDVVQAGVHVHDVGVLHHGVGHPGLVLVRAGEVGAQDQLDVPVGDAARQLAVLGHRQVPDVVLPHEGQGVGHGGAHVHRVGERRS